MKNAGAAQAMAFSTATLALAGFAFASPGTAPPEKTWHWYKGSLHVHTVHDGGDSTPSAVVAWYKENLYQFVALTDHNFLTEVDSLNLVHGAREKFLVLPGEEVTDIFESRPVHVNGIGLATLVPPQGGSSVLDTLRRNLSAVQAARGLPWVNHPNLAWALTSGELLELQDLRLLEIYNGHPSVNNLGGGGSESAEEMWDAVLSSGRRVYGVATDDAHVFKRFARELSNPGRGWVVVRAPELSAAALVRSLAAGDFYASTGVVLDDVRASRGELSIQIAASKPSYVDRVGDASPLRYRTYFIGQGGEALAISADNPAVYRFKGGERYVRARVVASNGDLAWVQPVFPDAGPRRP